VISTADLVDRYESAVQCCETQFRSFGRRSRFAGEIVTVDCIEDNVLVKQALQGPGRGKVLVVDGHGSLRCALVGDMIAGAALANGWEGLVIHGAVRDVAGLRRLDLGVLALGSNPCRSAKLGAGQRGVIVRFGGVAFQPGWWLVADEDGVLVATDRLPPDAGAMMP
jgi:regulator of ribonuclease activity A